MKIVFKTLQSIDGVVQVSLDGGKTWTKYNILNIKEDGGISISDNQDLSLIKIKSDSTVLTNLEVISSINIENSVDVSNIENLAVNKQTFNRKKLNYRCSIFDAMSTMQAWNLIEENSWYVIYNRYILDNLSIFEGDNQSITMLTNIFKSNIKSFSFGVVASEETYNVYGHTFYDAITAEQVKQDNVEIIYETIEHYKEALKNSAVIQLIKDMRDDLPEVTSISGLSDGEEIVYSHMVYRDGKYYDVAYIAENGDTNVELRECNLEKDKQFLVFFDDIITGIKRTAHPELNLNGTTINFNSTTDFVEMRLDNVNKFINKYDSENDIFYSLIATTNNENIPEELRYCMFAYINWGGEDPDLNGRPVNVWFSKEDSNTEIYSFNFEFNDNINDYNTYINIAGENGPWETDENGEAACYFLTSADKKGYKFIKDSDGNISYENFDFSTTKEYIAALSFIKKDDYSLYKKVVDKTPQIKIDNQIPNSKSLMIFDSEGKPSFITISQLRTELGIQQ